MAREYSRSSRALGQAQIGQQPEKKQRRQHRQREQEERLADIGDLADERQRHHGAGDGAQNSAERPLLSMIVADRAVCRVKCSVVRAWSSRWSPLTANARPPVSGKPDCPAAGRSPWLLLAESGSISPRSSVVLKHALRRYLVKSWLRGGRRRPEPAWREPWQHKARSRRRC